MDDYLILRARQQPDRVAYRMVPSGIEVSWKVLEERSRRCAAALIDRGFQVGDVIAICMENCAEFVQIASAARRAGLYYTPISRTLKAAEIDYLIRDSGARAVFFSANTAAEVTGALRLSGDPLLAVSTTGQYDGVLSFESLLQQVPADTVLPERLQGADFCYSSGTTGRPKGIKRKLEAAAGLFEAQSDGRLIYRAFDESTVYLTPAPLYHSAPLRYTLRSLSYGGQAIVMEKFDALLALDTIQRFGVTHSQWVPTMFKRMLELPRETRDQFDLSSMRYAIHASAPCPVQIKERMIEWWGPILYEFYAGTEVVGRTSLSSTEWLEHKGSVGLPEFGQVHVLDEDGHEVPAGQTGLVYFSGFSPFEYHNDPEKTRKAYNERGWGTYGDVGYLDDDGYLYLTDRVSNMIVSGGVNVYPEETEQHLAVHPKVSDVAVIGVPNDDFGEEVKAVVTLLDPSQASPVLEQELIDYCRASLSRIKCPRTIEFVDSLPRTETGKLLKRELKKKYWGESQRQIA